MAQPAAQPLRMRVQFTKEGRARYLSHSEYARTLMISARRAGLPLEYAGQNMSRMKVSLSPPLPIGITSACEYVDFNLTAYVSAAEAQSLLSDALPPGIRALQCRLLGADARPVGKLIDTAVFCVDISSCTASEGDWRAAVERFLEKTSVPYLRVQPRRTRTVDLRSGVHGISLEEGGEAEGVRMVLTLDDGIAGTIKPWEVTEVLAGLAEVPREVWEQAQIQRTGLFARRGERLVSPMEMDKRKAPAGRGTWGGKY
jgi:radical SAM-linked protein